MNYQEQKNLYIYINVLIVMTFLMIGYIVSVTISLFILSNELEKKTEQTVNIFITVNNLECEKIEPEPKPVENIPAPPVPEPQPEVLSDDTYLLAHIINAEAGNQPYEGMVAVGNVIMNRVLSPKFPNTIREVIYQRGQFSPVNNGTIDNEPNESAIRAAKDVMNGVKVVGDDVLFFYEPNIATDEWIRTRRVSTKIGDHIFAL